MMKRLIKFGVMSLFVGLIGFFNFSDSEDITFGTTNDMRSFYKSSFSVCPSNAVCRLSNFSGAGQGTFFVSVLNNGVLEYQIVDRNGLLSLGNGSTYFNIIAIDNKQSFSVTNGGTLTLGEVVTCPTCPECSVNECVLDVIQGGVYDSYTCSGDCNFSFYLDDNILYTGYNYSGNDPYIEVSSICSSLSGGDLTGINRSILHINDIEHIGAGFINITIPEEFDRDYIYTGNGEELDINVNGYNVDTSYIDGLITTQKTLPNNTDFNNTVSGLLPLFVPGIVIIFFLYFIFRFIKKVF